MKKNNWSRVPKDNWNRMRSMRADPTPAERILWQAIRSNQLGVHFRRQHTIGAYIVDFCAPRIGLIIEVDGDSHASDEAQEYDLRRDRFLSGEGFMILRFTNRDVQEDYDGVIDTIRKALKTQPPSPPKQVG